MADADAHVPGSVIFVFIDALFKLALNRGLEPPVFQQTEESGPPRHRTFTWTCTFHQAEHTLRPASGWEWFWNH